MGLNLLPWLSTRRQLGTLLDMPPAKAKARFYANLLNPVMLS
jgi:hypothetical protein